MSFTCACPATNVRNELVCGTRLAYFHGVKTLGQVLESADKLPLDEQEALVSILQRRLAEQRREELVAAVRESRREYRAGRSRPVCAAEIAKRIRS